MLKNVASQKIGAQMVSATDGSAFTGSVTVSVTGDAGTQATGSVGSGACTHEGNGYHTYAPAQAETNYDLVAFTFTGTGAVPTTIQVYTLPATGILAPTVLGRTLDVSAGGEAGVDWANVGSPTTSLALTGTTIATTQKVDVETIKTNPVVNAGTITFPTTATLASTTNITAATGVTLTATTGLGNQTANITGTITTATNVTTVNGLAANVITAAATAADFGAELATAIWTDTTAGDFTVALSVGKSLMNGVSLGTGLTVARCTLTDTLTTYTGNTPQTGDSYAIVNSGTHGNAAINTKLGTPAGASISADILVIDNFVDDLEGRLTATRAGYLDNLSAGAVALASGVAVTSIGANVITAASIAADAGVEIAAAVWDRVLTGATHNIVNSAGRRLRQLGATSIIGGTAASGASNSITLDGTASATNDIYDSNLIVLVGGTGAGQSRIIVEYNGATKVSIVDRVWEVTPDATSEYEMFAAAQADISHHGLAQAGGATSITLSSTANATDDTYIGSQVYLSTSTGTGQARLITAYNGTTKVATVSPAWTVNPTSSSVYKIIPVGRSIVETLGTQAKADVNAEVDTALADYDAPTNTEMVARTLAAASYATATALATAQSDLDLLTGADGATLATSQPNYAPSTAAALASLVTTVGVAGAGLTAADDAMIAAIGALNNLSSAQVTAAVPTVAQIWATALTEAYRATGATGTAAQLLYEILQNLTEFTISGTTKTVKQLNGSTTAKTYTLNDGTTPTGITETT